MTTSNERILISRNKREGHYAGQTINAYCKGKKGTYRIRRVHVRTGPTGFEFLALDRKIRQRAKDKAFAIYSA